MLNADEVLKVAEEWHSEPFANQDEFNDFVFEKFGRTEEVYDLLRVIVKSASEYLMNLFDALPEGIRKKLADCAVELDPEYVQDQLETLGLDITEKSIGAMERLAIKLLNKQSGFNLVEDNPKPQSYAEALAFRQQVAKEPVERSNAAN